MKSLNFLNQFGTVRQTNDPSMSLNPAAFRREVITENDPLGVGGKMSLTPKNFNPRQLLAGKLEDLNL